MPAQYPIEGCGAILPGYSFTFPDFDTGNTFDIPDDPDPPNPGPVLPDIDDSTTKIPPGTTINQTTQVTLVPLTAVAVRSNPIPYTYNLQQGTLYFFTFDQVCQLMAASQLLQNVTTSKNTVNSKITQSLATANWILLENAAAGGLSTQGRIGSPCSVLNTSQSYIYRVAAFIPNSPPPPPPTTYGFTLVRDQTLDYINSNYVYTNSNLQTIFGRLYAVGFGKVCANVTNNSTWQTQNQTIYNNAINEVINENQISNFLIIPPDGDLNHNCTSVGNSFFNTYIAKIFVPYNSNLGALQSGSTNQNQQPVGLSKKITSGKGLTDKGESKIQPTVQKQSTSVSNKNLNITNQKIAGSSIKEVEQLDPALYFGDAFKNNDLNLQDPLIVNHLLQNNPAGLQDPEIAIVAPKKTNKLVKNTSQFSELFNDYIHVSLHYLLTNTYNSLTWNNELVDQFTPTILYSSLNEEVKLILSKIINLDGTPLNINQIYYLIGSRIIEGKLSEITKQFLQKLVEYSEYKKGLVIKPSVSKEVNELGASLVIDKFKFPLDPSLSDGQMRNILPNWKTLSSDIDRYIEVDTGDGIKRYYVNDDDTFVDRSTLSLKDGEYFDIKVGNKVHRLYAKSEKDHAFLIPEDTRHKLVTMLGGDPSRTLEVSAPASAQIEYNYSLSAPRQNFYMLSCVLSSIESSPSKADTLLLRDTRATYKLIDTFTASGLSSANEFIKYKANNRAFIVDDDDLLLDYLEYTSSITMSQTDIISDSPKENKSIPILTRQIPWYIIIYPTNKPEFNVFNTRSKLVNLNASGSISRKLKFKTAISRELNDFNKNIIVTRSTVGIDSPDVLGNPNTETRNFSINADNRFIQSGYVDTKGNITSAQKITRTRNKTSLRVVKEVITELDNNYLLGYNALGKNLTEFDVISRLTLRQYNDLTKIQNYNLIRKELRNGLINNVKVMPVISKTDRNISIAKTQIIQRKEVAPADEYEQVREFGLL